MLDPRGTNVERDSWVPGQTNRQPLTGEIVMNLGNVSRRSDDTEVAGLTAAEV